jgi:phosphinothricin acetyltransferase
MLIRNAIPATDAAACAEIYRPFVTDSPVSFEEHPPSPAEFAEKIDKLGQTYPFLVAETAEGTIAGYAYASPYRERIAYRWSAEVSVYIHADHRGQGVGTKLYAMLLDQLRHQGFRVAIAGITVPNDASLALHKSFGFTEVGVFTRVGYKAGAWRDVAFLELQLLPKPSDEAPADLAPPLPVHLVVDQ